MSDKCLMAEACMREFMVEQSRKIDSIHEVVIRNSVIVENIEEKLNSSILIPKSLPKAISWIVAVPSGIIGVIITLRKLLG